MVSDDELDGDGVLQNQLYPDCLQNLGIPMPERIHIENYKCLRDVTVDLGDFTILIGPNGSGKSSFQEVIRNLGNILAAFAGDRSLANVVWRKDVGRHIVWELEGRTAGQRFVYRAELPVDRPPRESLEWAGKKLFWTEEVPAGDTPHPSHLPAGTVLVAIATAQGTRFQQAPVGGLYLLQLIGQNESPARGVADVLSSCREYQFKL